MDRKRPLDAVGAMPAGLPAEAGVKRAHVDFDSVDEEENPDYARLERFRKEAIYRSLRETRRELTRVRATARALEEALAQSRGAALAVNQFWDVMMEQLRVLRVDEGVLGAEVHAALARAVPLALDQTPAHVAVLLQERRDVVEQVLAAIAAHAARTQPSSSSFPAELEAVQMRCQALAAELSGLRQHQCVLEEELRAAHADAEKVTEKLLAAEKRVDRAQSASVKAVETPPRAPGKPASATNGEQSADRSAVASPAANGDEENAPTAESDAGAGAGAAAAGAAAAAAAAAAADAAAVRSVADARLQEIAEMRAELGQTKQQLVQLQVQLQVVPDEQVRAHPAYAEVTAEMVFLQQETAQLRAQAAAFAAENENMREFRLEFQHQTSTQANTHSDELQKQLKTRDADIVRLRGQRDELNAELLERRAREGVRFGQVDEVKALLAPKDERIAALHAHVQRLRMEVCALRGDSAALAAVEQDKDLAAAHALEASLDALRAENSALRQHHDGAADAVALQAHVERLEALLAAGLPDFAPDAPPDPRARWEALQQELRAAHLQLHTANASTATLCEEVDRLSAAYDQLEKQADQRVANMSRLEDKILRLTTEKSKADNKYFAAMRAKDAVDTEKRALARTSERQAKAIERYGETEKALSAQLVHAEKETTALRRGLQTHAAKLAELDRDRAVLQHRLAAAERARAAADATAVQQTAGANDAAGAQRRAEERVAALDREVTQLKRRVAHAAPSPGAGRRRGDNDTHLAYLDVRLGAPPLTGQSLLKCSACKERYRDRIITKCLHTFLQ
ncbi:RING-type E3 ubiquitin transferase [Malassezia sp. CBS 17886]|nr:RING-type E3 ubiquitin transferase [Malassezia sp. CBS 17886]